MKKILAFILVAIMVLGMTACDNSEPSVAVLWAEGDVAMIPNSLINSMDRAMYIEHISYKYYGANGDQAKQIAQAKEALNAGTKILIVELIDSTATQSILDLAKAKDAYVVFFGCEVDASAQSYSKCITVTTDSDSMAATCFDLVSEYVIANTEIKKPKDGDMDLDDDGKISYVTVGEIELAGTQAIEKDKKGEPKLKKDGSYSMAVELVKLDAAFADLQLDEETVETTGLFGSTTTYRKLKTADGKVVEMILVADDVQAKDLLIALQSMGMNADQLATCFAPLFTVGNSVDYKALVLEGAPASGEARTAHLEKNKFLCDLTGVKEEDLAQMIFTTLNVIDTGRLSGTVIEDEDAIAVTAASVVASILKGEAPQETVYAIPYTTYAN